MSNTAQRNGGDLVIETLSALGARTVFGIPGQHALGLFDALSRSTERCATPKNWLRYVSSDDPPPCAGGTVCVADGCAAGCWFVPATCTDG